MSSRDLTSQFWTAAGGAPAALEAVELTDVEEWLSGPLAVDDLAVAAVTVALVAASELALARTGRRPVVGLSAEHAALSFQSERHARLSGEPLGPGFAPLSRFVRCAGDGWVRTHGNYPHHAAALLRAVKVDPSNAESAVAGLEMAAGTCDAFARSRRPSSAREVAPPLSERLRNGELIRWMARPAGSR